MSQPTMKQVLSHYRVPMHGVNEFEPIYERLLEVVRTMGHDPHALDEFHVPEHCSTCKLMAILGGDDGKA